ncbi:MAG TPA: hypothetical protein VGC76_18605 [Pyrinomonadaceae bacterium]|jgi:hypothetical protein
MKIFLSTTLAVISILSFGGGDLKLAPNNAGGNANANKTNS